MHLFDTAVIRLWNIILTFFTILFLAQVSVYGDEGHLDNSESVSTCGYSCITVIYLLASGSLCITGGFLNGFWTCLSGIPPAGTCSVAISAACCPPADDTDTVFKQVQYGEVEMKGGFRHCRFTSHFVKSVGSGRIRDLILEGLFADLMDLVVSAAKMG